MRHGYNEEMRIMPAGLPSGHDGLTPRVLLRTMLFLLVSDLRLRFANSLLDLSFHLACLLAAGFARRLLQRAVTTLPAPFA